MKKKLACIVTILALMSCSNQAKKTPASKPKPYFGDSVLTISFKCAIDTAANREFRNEGVSELMILGNHDDTTIINMYKKLAPGFYKGACEFKDDTLCMNYWLDSVDCGSPCMNLITYKIRAKNMATDKLKTDFIYTGEAHKK